MKKIYNAYGAELPLIPVPHLAVQKNRAPAANDRDFAPGDAWIYRVSASERRLFVFGGLDGSGDAVWILSGPASSIVYEGVATLVAGTVTVANTDIQASDRVLITRIDENASTALGEELVTISAGVGFDIDARDPSTPGSLIVADVSSFNYIVVRANY